jgi:predicted nucleic acid-binding protein
MAFVLDASISAVWALADESDPLATRILDRWIASPENPEAAYVPGLWWYELRNLLVINECRKRIVSADSASFLRVVSTFPIEIDEEPDENSIFAFARRYQLSFYDAAYLEVAHRKGFALATLDKALRQAAENAGVALLA